MTTIKYVSLQLLLLAALSASATVVILILGAVFSLQYDSAVATGSRAGFCAWILLLIGQLYDKARKFGK